MEIKMFNRNPNNCESLVVNVPHGADIFFISWVNQEGNTITHADAVVVAYSKEHAINLIKSSNAEAEKASSIIAQSLRETINQSKQKQ
jgi:hypothetical protein